MTRRVLRHARDLVILAAAWLLVPAVLHAHAIHTTLTVVTATPDGLTLTVRAFADDFSATVAAYAGRRPPADSSAPAIDVLRYVQSRFVVRDAQGRPLTLTSCGTRRAAELYWLCFRVALPSGSSGVMVRNQLLTELHADQVNIVQVDARGPRRTLLFTRTSPPAAIAATR